MPAMTVVQALERLTLMVAAGSDPSLENDELVDLLTAAARADRYGLWPDDTGWTPTYDLNSAAAEGWRRKAGKVAGSFDFGTDGDTFTESQVFQQCVAQAERYQKKTTASVRTGRYEPFDVDFVVGNHAETWP